MKYRIVFDIQKYRYIDMTSIYRHPYWTTLPDEQFIETPSRFLLEYDGTHVWYTSAD